MTTYIVKTGDTLFEIAQSFYGDGYKYGKILDANPQITNPDLIRVGDLLNIPGVETSVSTGTTTSGGMGLSKQVIILATLAALGAGAIWYFNRGGMEVATNPEEDDEE